MKHNYLLCFILVCFVLFCYYYTPESQVVEGLDPKDPKDKDDTSRYAFRDEKGYGGTGGLLGGLFDKKAEVKPCLVDGKPQTLFTTKTVLAEAQKHGGKADTKKLKDPTCYKDVKCAELLEEKQAGCHHIPFFGTKCVGLAVNMKNLSDSASSDNKNRKGAEIMRNCIKGSKAEHKGIYYLGTLNDNYLNYLIEGLFGGCYIDLRSNINEAFYYALDKVDKWTDTDGNCTNGESNHMCKVMDFMSAFEYMFTAQDRVRCGAEITKNDIIRKI